MQPPIRHGGPSGEQAARGTNAARLDVVAVVVTHNRAGLLDECLTALLAQSTPVRVLCVDNASTDETPEVIERYADAIDSVRLAKNTGGAGGFYVGMKAAFDGGADLIWLMDDDTIAAPDSLERLLEARNALSGEVAFTCSVVNWTDGRPHPMNGPILDDRPEAATTAARVGAVAVTACSFVSVLIERRAVERHGLPLGDYFIWGDDIEYTTRLTVDGLGLLVPTSSVLHKTAYSSLSNPGPRIYYAVRNPLWSLRFSPGFRARRGLHGYRLLRLMTYQLKRARDARLPLWMAKGLVDGLVRRPDLGPMTERRLERSQERRHNGEDAEITAEDTFIVIPADGKVAMTQDLVREFRRQGPSPVVVVDNAGGYQAVAGETVLRPATDLGWLRATNVGTRWALDHGARAVLWSDSDVTLSEDFIAGLVGAVNTAGDVGAVAPVYDGVNNVQRRGYSGEAAGFRGRAVDHETSSADWTSYVVRAAALAEVGLLDEATFARHGWGAIDDFSLRLRSSGWRVLVTERSYVHHEGRVTTRDVGGDHVPAALAEMWLGLRKKYGRNWPAQFPGMEYVRSERLPYLRDRVRLRRAA